MSKNTTTLGYQVKVTYTLVTPDLKATYVYVLVELEVPWNYLPQRIQQDIIQDAFKICKDGCNRSIITGSGQFRIDRIVFDLNAD